MELKDYWRTVRRRWKLILTTVLLTVGIAAAYTWTVTPQYASSARLFVSTTPSDTADAYQGNLFASQRVTSYAEIVDGRRLAGRVADALGGERTVTELLETVSASVVPETVILEITATDPDPIEARDIAQAYAEELSDLVPELEAPGAEERTLINATITDDAVASDEPVSPQPVRNLGLAFVLGLLLGIGLAVLRELLDTTIGSNEDVEAVTETPILGHIIADGGAVRSQPAEVLGSASPWAEAFRVLRTNMQYVEVDHEQRVFVVSSSLPGEGKTTTAANLAVTMAMAGQRVALVECDLRRPLIASRLGLDGATGTTSVLIGKVSLEDALQPYQDTGLQVLACGPIPPNPSELLQSHAMTAMLEQLRSRFDTVILDAPPLLPVTDAALLTAQVDGAMVVVRHGRTTRDQLMHAVERLTNVDAKTVGVVINAAPARKSNRSYGYGYGYGYGYAPHPTADDGTGPSAQAGRRRGKHTPVR
ncbi:polysaccharide biosynthesis tyrosine autokinase [Nocardioides sp. SYSU DS0663]|uniref:polysaccharide biosynthesis tyrosine autokinase n=1 Tax=Nocardioides sp. SYSU DS0663 TaxID=3416445 RepID=UPI003F4B20B4